MELRHLRYFVAVAEELNFTKAAQRMNTVQPSLSQQIRDLEAEVGVQLLKRSNRKVELTAEGEAFLKEAILSLQHAHKAIDDARQVALKQKDHLTIGFVPVAEMKVFPYIMPNIRAYFPQLSIQFKSMTDAEQFEALKKGEIDIAFTRYIELSDELQSLHVFQEPLTLIVPKQSSVAEQPSVSIQSFQNQDFIVSEPLASPQLYKITQDFFKQHKIKANFVQHSNNILLNINLVGMGVGWSLVPLYVSPLLGDKVLAKPTVEPLPMIDLYACFRNNDQNEALDLIVKILKAHFLNSFEPPSLN